jgi:hypothetical protein
LRGNFYLFWGTCFLGTLRGRLFCRFLLRLLSKRWQPPKREQKEDRNRIQTKHRRFAAKLHFVLEGSVKGRTARGKVADSNALPQQHCWRQQAETVGQRLRQSA